MLNVDSVTRNAGHRRNLLRHVQILRCPNRHVFRVLLRRVREHGETTAEHMKRALLRSRRLLGLPELSPDRYLRE
jgi:hypothetical protein